MSDSAHVFRIHPAIGIARVGNSQEYVIGPETMAGLPVPGAGEAAGETAGETLGGLPIRPGTESEMITSRELRDRDGALKRQAARFKIFQYPREAAGRYRSGAGTEVTIGSVVEGRRVADIVWTAHLANKKASAYIMNDDLGLAVYERAHAAELQLRNLAVGSDPDNAARLRKLIIDPGPRAIRGTDTGAVRFDKSTFASFGDSGARIQEIRSYPKSFPDDSFSRLYTPVGNIDSLGELRTDEQGRLLVLGGYGKACSRVLPDGTPYPLINGAVGPGNVANVNEEGWFDDAGDGPVAATLVFEDGGVQPVHGAWAVVADPSFAPQILNVVTLWDQIYDTWVRELDLCPEIHGHRFRDAYKPFFDDDLFPIFRAASLQRWTTNLPERAIQAHDAVGRIRAEDDPGDTILTGLAYIRDPNNPRMSSIGAPFMPLSTGDSGRAFLSVTLTQYFFLSQWNKGRFHREPAPRPGPGELLDQAVLVNCVGGDFGPGLEMTFIVKDPELYRQDWRESGAGPFRIRAAVLDYNQAQASQPFLTMGYVPFHPAPGGVEAAPLEPGDISKFMAVPWHTDFNACATHNPDPNPRNLKTLYWAWPAQRPVDVHVAREVRDGRLGPVRYSIRGPGTYSDDPSQAGRFADQIDIVLSWHRIGFVIQGSAIDGGAAFSPEQFLEVESLLDEPLITPWPMYSENLDS
ncbi:MAG TPA: LodA/GoxA family CTQ-dependent oxidase [Thermoanaerobaculia bacterium]|nr:LodA/GoxA family CTQ-dependent oxidase [Thermoanaerobaculia bacterium]